MVERELDSRAGGCHVGNPSNQMGTTRILKTWRMLFDQLNPTWPVETRIKEASRRLFDETGVRVEREQAQTGRSRWKATLEDGHVICSEPFDSLMPPIPPKMESRPNEVGSLYGVQEALQRCTAKRPKKASESRSL